MGFSEKIKLEVKRKSMFRCCRCQAVGVDVHHILPQKDRGLDEIDNAAPLCQNCHDQLGDNPNKRKEITQMRDNWYQVVGKMYSPKLNKIYPLIEKVGMGIEEMERDRSRTQKDLSEIKDTLKEISDKAIDNMTFGTASLVAANMVSASGASLSNARTEDIIEIELCPSCRNALIPKNSICPLCRNHN